MDIPHQGKSTSVKHRSVDISEMYLSASPTEVWELLSGNNKKIEPTLPSRYDYGIVLYAVDEDFCKK